MGQLLVEEPLAGVQFLFEGRQGRERPDMFGVIQQRCYVIM